MKRQANQSVKTSTKVAERLCVFDSAADTLTIDGRHFDVIESWDLEAEEPSFLAFGPNRQLYFIEDGKPQEVTPAKSQLLYAQMQAKCEGGCGDARLRREWVKILEADIKQSMATAVPSDNGAPCAAPWSDHTLTMPDADWNALTRQAEATGLSVDEYLASLILEAIKRNSASTVTTLTNPLRAWLEQAKASQEDGFQTMPVNITLSLAHWGLVAAAMQERRMPVDELLSDALYLGNTLIEWSNGDTPEEEAKKREANPSAQTATTNAPSIPLAAIDRQSLDRACRRAGVTAEEFSINFIRQAISDCDPDSQDFDPDVSECVRNQVRMGREGGAK